MSDQSIHPVPRSRLLIITGDLAAGKSTLSGRLAARYGIPVLNKDTMKEILCDTVGMEDREQSIRLSRAAVRLMHYTFGMVASAGSSLILEANFRTPELEELHATAAAHGYRVLTVCLRGDIHLLHERYLNRLHNEHRHPAHAIPDMEQEEAFRNYLLTQRAMAIPGDTVTVNVDNFPTDTDLRPIDDFMAE